MPHVVAFRAERDGLGVWGLDAFSGLLQGLMMRDRLRIAAYEAGLGADECEVSRRAVH